MRQLNLARRVVLLLAVLLVAGVGVVVAYASIPDASGVIHGCYKKKNGQLRVVKSDDSQCRPSEKPISWSQTGPQGPPGISGYEQQAHQVFVPAAA
jgi:hypothetical protein